MKLKTTLIQSSLDHAKFSSEIFFLIIQTGLTIRRGTPWDIARPSWDACVLILINRKLDMRRQ